MSISVSCYALAISLLLAACTKEGPAGPQGPQGNEGPGGARGPAGPKGDTGTANVIYSDWLDVAYSQAGTQWLAVIGAPKLDIKALTTGEIKVYLNIGFASNPQIFALPHDDGNNRILCLFYIGPNRIVLNIQRVDKYGDSRKNLSIPLCNHSRSRKGPVRCRLE